MRTVLSASVVATLVVRDTFIEPVAVQLPALGSNKYAAVLEPEE